MGLGTLSAQFPPWLLLAGGAMLGWLRSFWTALYNRTIGQVVRRVTVSVTVEEMDHAQAWVWLQWWAEKRLRERRISALLLRQVQSENNPKNVDVTVGPGMPRENNSGYELVPAYGVYPFRWRRRYLLVFNSGKDDNSTAQAPGNFSNFLPPRRQVTLTIWGTRERELLLEIIAEAREEWEAGHPAALHYFFHRYNYWNSRPMPSRPRNTVYLPEGVMDDLFADARRFLAGRARYEPMGIPWRRGYLLHGPPGGGKTTLVQCLATELGLPLYYLSLAALRSREDLAELLDNVRCGSLVLIEDIDCIAAAAERMNKHDGGAVNDSGTQSATVQTKITPSDLLNTIDGIIASQGRILVMTTNYPERLDRALVRAGRVDRRLEIGYARREELLSFHAAARRAEMTEMDAGAFLRQLPNPATIADAQALLFQTMEGDGAAAIRAGLGG